MNFSSNISNHIEKKCDCYTNSSTPTCIYRMFSDGWNFVAENGRGTTHAEIFTPYPVVLHMISKLPQFDETLVYHNHRSIEHLDPHIFQRALDVTVLEPAVGTGNFISEVFWLKLIAAGELAENQHEYDALALQAASTIYAYDIDPGNLATTIARLTGSDTCLDSEDTISYWCDHIKDRLDDPLSIDDESLREHVTLSLCLAQTSWGKNITKHGVLHQVSQLYGWEVRDVLENSVITILKKNIQLFNGIVEQSQGFVPGWGNISWDIGGVVVSVRSQLLEGDIERLQLEADQFYQDHCVVGSELGGLFDMDEPTWDNETNRKKHQKILKKIATLKENLQDIM